MFINVEEQVLNNNCDGNLVRLGRLIRLSSIEKVLESTDHKAIIVFKKGSDYPNMPDLYTNEYFYNLVNRLGKLGYCI